MKKILKRNQIMITALALMLVIAGYLSFAGRKLDDEEFLPVNSDDGIALTGEYEDTDELLMGQSQLDNDGLESSSVLDISDEDMEQANSITDINSLDSEVDAIASNYLDEDMAEVAINTADKQEGFTVDEIPGEAIFTAATGVNTFSGAKLLKEQTRAKNKETLMQIIDNLNIMDTQKQVAIDKMIELTDIAEKETSAEILLEAKGFGDVVVSISNGMVDVMINATTLSDAHRAQIEDIVKRKTEISGENIIITPVSKNK